MNPPDIIENAARTSEELPGVVTRLFRGVVYAESDGKVWQSLIALESQARDYVAVLGLDLILDESEGSRSSAPARTRRATSPGSSRDAG